MKHRRNNGVRTRWNLRFGPCFLVVIACLITGCQQKMANQPRYDPLEASRFFPDGLSARHPVSGTVVRGGLRDDALFFTGKKPAPGRERVVGLLAGAGGVGARQIPSLKRANEYTESFPYPVTAELLRRGQVRYRIYCLPCHGADGSGTGKIVEHGYSRAKSFQEERLRDAPVGYLFDVITHGYQAMPSYAKQVAPRDRWAVIAYIRAMQHRPKDPLQEADQFVADLPVREGVKSEPVQREIPTGSGSGRFVRRPEQ